MLERWKVASLSLELAHTAGDDDRIVTRVWGGCPADGALHPCTLGALIEYFLQRTASAARCNPAGQVEPPGAPERLPDRRPLPAGAFADPAAGFREEAPSGLFVRPPACPRIPPPDSCIQLTL